MSCHDSSPNYIPVGINYNNVTGKATGLAEIRTLDVAEIKPVDGILTISGTQIEIKTTNLILSSDVDVFIPGNLVVSGSIIGETTPVNLDAYITSSTFNPFSATVNSHIGTQDIHFTSGGLVAYTDTIYPALSNYNSHIGSGSVHYTSGSLSGYYAASSWVEANFPDNADFNAHTGSGSVHFTSGSLSSYYAVSTVVDSRLSGKQNQDPTLDAIANITTAASTLIYFSGTDLAATTTLSDFARNILDDSNATTVRSTIGTVIGADVQGYSTRLNDLDLIARGAFPAYPQGTLAWGSIPVAKVLTLGAVSSFAPLSAGPTEEGRFLRVISLGGGLYEPFWSTFNLTEVADVADTAPGTNTFLRYDGSVWSGVSATLSGSLADVDYTGDPLPNSPLYWDGTKWTVETTSDPNGGLFFYGFNGINTSSTVASAVSSTYEFGSPFVWQYNSNDPLQDAEVSGNQSWWGGLNLSSWVNTALRPKLDSVYVNVSGDSANAGFHFSSLSANRVFVSASVSTVVPLEVRFAPNSTTSHVLFASADGTEIARINLRGNNNLFFGFRGGMNMTSTTRSTGVGHYSLEYLTTGSDNTAFGYLANYTVNTGARNTAVGSESSRNLTTASDNTSIGHQANHTLVNGAFNTAVGAGASRDASSGQGNVSVGYRALYNNQVGTGNIGIGYRAGQSFSGTVAGSNNIAIGYDSNQSGSNSYSSTITIGSGITSTASNQTIIGHPQTSSTIIRGAVSAASYVNAPTTSGTFSTGDVLYYNGSIWVKLAKPANPAVLLIDDLNGTGLPYWEEAPNTAPNTTYTLQVTTDGSNNPGAIFWG